MTGIETTTYDDKGVATTVTESIAYDAIGNPINYRGATIEWYGRQMTSYSKGNVSATFAYDADGLRGSKTVNGAKTTYFYVGDQLMYESRPDGTKLYFYYDSYGALSAIRYVTAANNEYYYYVTTNKQGDVLGIYSAGGDLKASYEYDSWGNCTVKDAEDNIITSSNHIGNINPIRYRGYYYDNDLGLYYLQSRYYDATIGRFINADSEISGIGSSILGNNSFAYCQNNPVNSSDPTGHWPKWLGGALTIAGGVAQIAAGAALGAFSSWTGIGAVAAGLLVINGGATVVQGIGQVVNAVTKSNIMREDNMVRTTVQAAGQAVGGDAGGEIAGYLYDGAVTAASMYAGSVPKTVCGCFIAGTAVFTALGNKAIEDIKAGELVWSENPETDEKALKQVVRTFVNESDILIHVFVNGEEIIATPEHPFYIPQKGWIGAIELRAGDILVLQNGEYVIVEKVQHEILEEPITVYNFEVEDFHTYYVGDSSVLVHNTCNVPTKDLIPTHGLTASRTGMSQLVSDIKNNGIQNSIKYVSFNGGKYIVDGHHRVAAAISLGIDVVPAMEVQLPYGGYKTTEDLFW